jgi:hypothetical protein
LAPWKRESIDEIPSHHGFGFVCVQFAGARWMYLPMRQWADATPLQQRPRYRAALHGDMRPGRAFNRPNQSADDPATGHDILPTGPDLRPVRKLPLATGLPMILNSNQLSIDFTDAAAANGRPLIALALAFALVFTLRSVAWAGPQGNLPKPVQNPPVVCVAPNWASEPCESRRPPAQPVARTPAKSKTVLYNEPGGILQDHIKRWQALAASEDEIRGPCVSGCTMIMAFVPSDRICFGDAASLQFHMARNATNQEPNVDTAGWMLNQYPQDIRLWIRAKGGVEKMTFMQSGSSPPRNCGPWAIANVSPKRPRFQ